MHNYLFNVLKRYGLTESDVEIVNLPNADVEAALLSGDIDAASLTVTWGSRIVNNNDGFQLLELPDDIKPATSYVVSNGEFLKENPEIVARFLKIVKKVENYVEANPDEAISIISNRTDYSADDLQYIKRWIYAPYLDAAGLENFQDTANFLYANELIDNEVDVSIAYTDKYLIEAERLLAEE
jgi:ABC-type nitrate/sulfonate/bicarbonate transport systems, periplasmic components